MRFRRVVNCSVAVTLIAIALAGCGRSESHSSEKLSQRGYLWQRDWTPSVIAALMEANRRLDGTVLLGGEISLGGNEPAIIRTNIDWDIVRLQKSCAVALRVAPYGNRRGLTANSIQFVVREAKSLVAAAKDHRVKISEFQLDYDCPQRELATYASWVGAVANAIRPIRFLITALPSWLDEPELVSLLEHVDGYVLQVHSVPISSRGLRPVLCDTAAAAGWIAKASRLNVPFSVALPTYRCSGGYDASGRLLNVAMDGVQPAWAPGTTVLEFTSPAAEIAKLIDGLQHHQPNELRGIIWYRVPVATDARNWRWPTLAAVMAGRPPDHRLDLCLEGSNPIDVSITNTGADDQELNCIVRASTTGGPIIAADALPGWTVQLSNREAIFRASAQTAVRLRPGDRRSIGWVRCPAPSILELNLAEPP